MLLLLGVACSFFLIFNIVVEGSILFPSFLATALILTGFRHSFQFLTHQIRIGMVLLIFTMLIVSVTPEANTYLIEKAVSAAQLLLSLLLAMITYATLIKIPRATRHLFYRNTCIVVLGFSLLEITLPFIGVIFDALRGAIYYDQFIYDAIDRDILAYGFLRPKFLSSEPSYLGFALGVFLAFYHLTCAEKVNFTKFMLLIVVASFIIRSPAVFVIPLAALFFTEFSINKKRTVRAGVTAVFMVVAFFVFWSVFSERPQNMLDSTDFSAFSRVNGPLLITWDYLSQHFVFGAGVGGKELLYASIRSVYFNAGFDYRISLISDATIINLLANSFWLHWLYWGAVGGLLYWVIIFRLFQPNDRQVAQLYVKWFWFSLMLMTISVQFIGGYENLRVWVMFAVYLVEFGQFFHADAQLRGIHQSSGSRRARKARRAVQSEPQPQSEPEPQLEPQLQPQVQLQARTGTGTQFVYQLDDELQQFMNGL